MIAVAARSTPVRLAVAAMGTRFELVLEGEDPVALRTAGEAAIERIEELHRHLSRFDPASLVSHLRRVSPHAVAVGADLFPLFEAAELARTASGGAFDIGAGASGLTLDPDRSTVAVASSVGSLDFGAIAKGFALDQAAAILRAAGVARAFLHGGTSSAIGIGGPWTVALGGRNPPIVTLTDSALGVSASWVDRGGGPEPHVVDPRTGMALTARRRAAVLGPSALWADAWSTAALVLGHRPPASGAGWRLWLGADDGDWTEIAAPAERVGR